MRACARPHVPPKSPSECGNKESADTGRRFDRTKKTRTHLRAPLLFCMGRECPNFERLWGVARYVCSPLWQVSAADAAGPSPPPPNFARFSPVCQHLFEWDCRVRTWPYACKRTRHVFDNAAFAWTQVGARTWRRAPRYQSSRSTVALPVSRGLAGSASLKPKANSQRLRCAHVNTKAPTPIQERTKIMCIIQLIFSLVGLARVTLLYGTWKMHWQLPPEPEPQKSLAHRDESFVNTLSARRP